MKSLEDIYLTKSVSHLEKGVDGITKQVTRNFKQKLNVKTISSGLRFVHLIVDIFIINSVVLLLQLIPNYNEYSTTLFGFIILFFYPSLYVFFEYKFQQTPGKMITNYIVINEYAEKPDLRTCILRSLIRFVPFEALSCLGSPSRGWHDRWTKTYVISKTELPKLQAILEKYNNVSE